MIQTLHIENFKSLRDVTLHLGDVNILVGTNASGKSNILDAFRVLQGIGYGFTVDEIFNGKTKSVTSDVWEGIRGGSSHAILKQKEPLKYLKIQAEIADIEMSQVLVYNCDIAVEQGVIYKERLSFGKKNLFKATQSLSSINGNEKVLYVPIETIVSRPNYRNPRGMPPTRGGNPRLNPLLTQKKTVIRKFDANFSILHQLSNLSDFVTRKFLSSCIQALQNIQNIDPLPAILRTYSQVPTITRIGERGENFAALVNTLMQGEEAVREGYLSWLRQLSPTEIDDIEILKGALNEPMFAIKERGNISPAPILSDGTLRFAAIAAALFQPDLPAIMMIEEIENGIHPTRLRLLLELLRTRTAYLREQGRPLQIILTTHSPALLSWLKKSEYSSVFLCKRDEETGESRVTSLADLPEMQGILEKYGLGELFAEGWMESVV
jgi:predicted ATPase